MIRVSGMASPSHSNVITHRANASTCHTDRVGPDGIIAKMRAIRDVRMRTLALVEALTEGEPVAWVEALASIIARAHIVDDADAVEMLETLTHAIADPALPYKARQGLYEAAVERNLPAIARLFLVVSPKNQLSPALKKQLGPERPLRPT